MKKMIKITILILLLFQTLCIYSNSFKYMTLEKTECYLSPYSNKVIFNIAAGEEIIQLNKAVFNEDINMIRIKIEYDNEIGWINCNKIISNKNKGLFNNNIINDNFWIFKHYLMLIKKNKNDVLNQIETEKKIT